jgi:hypothetical protein
MKRFRLRRFGALAALTAGGILAQPSWAVTQTFGTPLSGTGPTATFASLSFNQIGDGDDWQFTLSADNLASIFGASGAFIGVAAVDVPGSSPNYHSGLPMGSVSGGVSSVAARNGGGPTGVFDFRLGFGGGSDRLTSNESVTWTWNNSGYTSFNEFALHVQGLEGNTAGNSGSIWYVPSPVPEPETYALMLAGLGAMVFLGKRRRG